MDTMETVRQIMNANGITEFGVCAYDAIPYFLPCRNADTIPQNAQSVLVFAVPYATPRPEKTNLCAYARVPDYHVVVGALLKKLAEALELAFAHKFAGFTDISALPEKDCAVLAGIGFLGRNNLIINKTYGSYFVLGELVTDLYLPPSAPNREHCVGCGACVHACPSGALGSNQFDETRCLSAVTQRKGELSEEEIDLIRAGGLVWGCDICQQVCPHNRHAALTTLPEFYEHIEPLLSYENLRTLKKSRAFGWRGEKLLLRNLSLFDKQQDE